jgi:lipopolysaccharide export system permease protein
MIRLLDRYVTGLFVSALAIFTATFLALFVTVDFAPNLTRFLDLKSVPILRFIAWYYAIRLPLFLALVLPVVVLFAAIFTVIKLQRTNEVLPIAASGTSLRRMSVPFLVAGVVAAAGGGAIEEFVLPTLAPELARTEGIKSSKEVSYGVADYIESAWIWGRTYDHVKQEMRQDVRVMILGPDGRPAIQVRAARCPWDHERRRWVAFEGKVEFWSNEKEIHPPPNGGRPQPRIDDIPPTGYVVEAPFKVEALRTSASASDRYAFAPIRVLLRAVRQRPDLPVWRMRVHTRFAFPLSPLVLLFMGLPSVVAAHSKSFVRGLVMSALYVALYYPVHFFMMDLGNHGAVPPAIAGWFATAVFGGFGLVSFSRMRT